MHSRCGDGRRGGAHPLQAFVCFLLTGRKIQATKEQYKKSYNKAMNFEKTSKPVMIKEKLPRPGNEYSKYNSSLERASRRLDREKTVIEQLIQDKVGRGISLDKKYYKN